MLHQRLQREGVIVVNVRKMSLFYLKLINKLTKSDNQIDVVCMEGVLD